MMNLVREATRDLLMSTGYRARTFGSAEAFLASDNLKDIACLITDVKMPGISGLELQCRLVNDGYVLPVIFITAFPEEKLRLKATEAGASGFFSKPYDVNSFLLCVENAMAGQATQRP